jgi:hypothetical protein
VEVGEGHELVCIVRIPVETLRPLVYINVTHPRIYQYSYMSLLVHVNARIRVYSPSTHTHVYTHTRIYT